MKTSSRRWWWSFTIATCALLHQLPAQADPPSRVVRLSDAAGQVSFNPAGSRDWVRVHLNRPIVAGDRLWVDAGSRAELRLGQAAVRLGEDTSVALLNFDDRMAQLRLTQGVAIISAKRLDRGQVLEVDTPHFAWRLNQPGLFRIEADPAGEWTEITLRSGKGEVYGEGRAFMLASGRTYRFYGTDLADYETYPLDQPDALERWAMTRDAQRERAIAARYVSPDVAGYEDLDRYGRWRTVANLGAVWLPDRVSADWTPYRQGHWAWIEPWGWTWIDEAPWGFAPSHYGRWARIEDQWAWVPGPRRSRAVYAPAVVQFVGGNGPRESWQVNGTSAVAWFPLAPSEVYRPPYEASRNYLVAVNASNTIVRPSRESEMSKAPQATAYVYRQIPSAVVAVPTTTFAQAKPVAPSALRVTPETATRQPVTTVAAVAPIIASIVGAAIEAHRKPPEAAVERSVIAKAPPPPAPAPFAARQEALASQAGKPLPTQPIASPAPGATPAPPVKVVTASPPAAAPLAPKPASGANATARAERASEAARSAAAAASAPTLLPQALSRGAASAPVERPAQASPAAPQAVTQQQAGAPGGRTPPSATPHATGVERPSVAASTPTLLPQALSRGAASAPVERPAQASPAAPSAVTQQQAAAPGGRTPPSAAAERSSASSHAPLIERPSVATAAPTPLPQAVSRGTASAPAERPAPALPASVPARSATLPTVPPPTTTTRPPVPPSAPEHARASEAPARVAEGPRAPPVPLRETPASQPATRPAFAPPQSSQPTVQAPQAANAAVALTPARPSASAARAAASAASRPFSRASEERAPPHAGARPQTKEGGGG